MSNNTIHDFLNVLQQAAADSSRIPQLESELRAQTYKREEAERHSQALETNIQSYKAQIDALTEKLRSVEAERDDVGFRLLEAEDRNTHSIRSLKEARAQIDNILGVVAPTPAPEPTLAQSQPEATPESHPHPVTLEARSESPTSPPPTSAAETSSDSDSSAQASAQSGGPAGTEPVPTSSPPSSGVSEGKEAQPANTAPSGGSTPSAAVSDAPAAELPYKGVKFIDTPVHVKWEEWIAGGGNPADNR